MASGKNAAGPIHRPVDGLLSPEASPRAEDRLERLGGELHREPRSLFRKLPAGVVTHDQSLSPPISPDASAISPIASATVISNISSVTGLLCDPPLYDDPSPAESHPEMPLFPRSDSLFTEHDSTIDEHMAKKRRTSPSSSSPTRDDYATVLDVMHSMNSNMRYYEMAKTRPEEYVRWMIPQWRAHKKGLLRQARLRETGSWTSSTKREQRSVKKQVTHKMPKLGSSSLLSRKRATSDGFEATPNFLKPVKRSKVTKPILDAKPAKARPTTPKAPKPEKVDFTTLTDYSPPISTLQNGNAFGKIDWPNGPPLDLSDDVNKHLLHDAELRLASTLRLTCASYLASKRLFFGGYVHFLKEGKEYNKTAAQKACNIDVNKTSKLHTAFEKAGWLRPELVRQYL
ncbi:hypothetical protein LTR66_004211 [Elasticomyces elasticus]|nr:hypothetical protein LTR66_004211 [Elasticomyces elasticus]